MRNYHLEKDSACIVFLFSQVEEPDNSWTKLKALPGLIIRCFVQLLMQHLCVLFSNLSHWIHNSLDLCHYMRSFALPGADTTEKELPVINVSFNWQVHGMNETNCLTGYPFCW